jgi:hypothetical protein
MAPLRRIRIVALGACAAAWIAGCAIQVLETDDYDETFAPAGAARIALEGLDGDVVVRGLDTGDVVIRGTRYSVGATRREAREGLKHAALDAERSADDLVLRFDPPLELDGLVDLELDRVSNVPREMGLSVAVEAGDIDVVGLAGELDLETGQGDLDVDDFGVATARLTTEGGDVRYSVGLVGFFIECRAAGGAVEVDDALVDAGVDVNTEADGTVVLTYGGDGAGKQVALTTAGGGGIRVSLNDGSP